MIRGINLILAGIYVLGNVTGPQDETVYVLNDPDRYNWEVELDQQNVSLAEIHAAKKNVTIPTFVKVTTLQSPPYSSVKNASGTLIGTGYAFEVFDLIAPKLNLTYEIVMPETPGLGRIDGKNSQGIMDLVWKKKVDMVVAFLPILWELQNYCSYSPILDDAEIMALMRRPDESAVGSGLLAPFDTTVWICILIALIVIGPVVFVFTYFRSYLWDNTKVDKYNFTSCAWFSYGALVKQGSSITPVNDSTRLLFATWWIFITLLTSFYTANLTAFLTLSQFTLQYKSVDDIVKKKVLWVSETDRTLDNILDTGHGELVQTLATAYYKDGLRTGHFRRFDHVNQILDYLQRNRLFIGERDFAEKTVFDDYRLKTIQNVKESDRCSYVIMPEHLYRIPRGFMYQKDSLIQEAFDKQLQILTEVGIIKHLQEMNMPAVKYCPLNLKSTERQLRNSDLSLTYKVIGGGFVSACVTFLCELILRRKDVDCLCCRRSCICCRERTQTPKVSPTGQALPPKNNYVRSISSPPNKLNNHANLGNNYHIQYPSRFGKASPIYESVYSNGSAKKTYVNGRDYWVVTEPRGDKRLIPIRTPSALLFQYTS